MINEPGFVATVDIYAMEMYFDTKGKVDRRIIFFFIGSLVSFLFSCQLEK